MISFQFQDMVVATACTWPWQAEDKGHTFAWPARGEGCAVQMLWTLALPVTDPVKDGGSFSAVTVRRVQSYLGTAIASYGSYAPCGLQVLDTKDSFSVFIAFEVTDHWGDGPLCLHNVSAVGTIALLTESLLH